MSFNPAVPTPIRVNLSNLNGSLSLACWIILLLPQLVEQWRTQSADGLAFGFLMAWLVGDVCNLIGAIWGGLRPNVVLLALWFCLSDTILIVSWSYYSRQANLRHLMNKPGPHTDTEAVGESTPLLDDEDAPEEIPTSWLLSTGAPLALVVIVGYASFALSSEPEEQEPVTVSLGPQIFGYLSTIFYFCARLPQILQNYRRKSVHGLSIGFFTLSLLGNVTYCLSIVIYRWDKEWMVEYMPWFLGSALAISEDMFILLQFMWYGAGTRTA